MKFSSAISLALIVLLAPVTLAADEIVLRGGGSGIADVVETTEDSIKIKYIMPDGPTATIGLKAHQLDPHNFYTVRNKHMEKTVENHLKLAKFCIETELFSRAKIQINKAKEIDPEKVDLILDDSKVREAIAERLLKYIARELKTGDMAEAEKYIHVLLTRLPETKAAEIARQNLDKVEEARETRQAKAAADRDAAIEAKEDEQEKKDAKEKSKALAPIYKHIDAGEKMSGEALRQKNGSQVKKGMEAAGMHFEAAVRKVEALRKKVGDHPELDQLEAEAKADAINCYINAGNVDLSKGSYNQADKYARRALSVDQNSAAAKDFQNRVTAGSAMSGGWGRGRGRR
jgi:tetratricopeptide (TPR) repeat protein